MSTYVQSASSRPTARDLLNLLHSLEMTNPKALDKHIGWWDSEMGEYMPWDGRLEIKDDIVGLDQFASDAVKQAYAVEAERRRREYLASPPVVARSAEVERARVQGLLPPGA